MISTTFNGGAAWVLPYAPSWGRPVTVSARVPAEISGSLTGREIRRAHGASLRCVMRWEAILSSAEIVQLRDAMRVYADEPVIVPAWPFLDKGRLWQAKVGGGVTIGWADDWSSWDLNPDDAVDWQWVAPALVGRVTVDLPTQQFPGLSVVSFVFEEEGSSAWSLSPQGQTWATGPALNDASTPYVFPLPIGWFVNPRSGVPSVEISRRNIGRAPRTRAAVQYPQSAAIPVEGTVDVASLDEAAKLLRWWQDNTATTRAHYVPTLATITEIPGAVSAGATSITVSDASKLGAYRFLAIEDGSRIQWVRVLSVAGNVLALAAPIAYGIRAGVATVAVAILARHASEDIELTFERPGFARARISWEEVPEEYVIASGETRGATVGAAPLRAWLYKITVDRLGTLTVYRRTSFERDLAIGSDTWTAAPISHSAMERSVRLDRDEVTIETRTEPWASVFLPGNLTARVTVEISECDVSGSTGSNVATRWTGEISRVSFDGPLVRASCSGPYSVFDRQVPRVTIQPGCNHAVYDSGCGLSSSDWTFTAAVNATTSGRTVVLKTWARTLGLPTGWGFANYFALGYLSRGTERWLVLSSSAVSGGLVTLTLDRVATWTADEAVSVVTGCDGRPETCRAYHASTNPEGKFSNYARFLGFPFSPPKNPSFSIPKRSGTDYGKK